MVQKEVKKKTGIYGSVAILSAIILISLIYVFGSTSPTLPSSQNPVSNNSPAPEPTVSEISTTPDVSAMKTFSSIGELKSYLETNTQGGSLYYGGSLGAENFAPMPTAQSTGTYGVTNDYSTTNIQVVGVDEADTVKTDGKYIYTISSTQNIGYPYYGYASQTSNNVYIISAGPQNAKVVSKIILDSDTNPAGFFLSQDGNRLVVLVSKYQSYSYAAGVSSSLMFMPTYGETFTSINIYDVSNKANPVLTRNFTTSGSYFDSRMIGNYLYTVTSQSAYIYNDAVTVPTVYLGGKAVGASPTSIYYADMNQSNYYTFTSFYGLNILDDQQQPTNMTVLMSGASTMYVSQNNIYVAYPNWLNGGDVTSIYRVKINGLQLTFEAQGSVPGNTINQYAMDEYNGNLRIATSMWQNTAINTLFGTQQGSQINNVYVLNQNLTIVGKLEGLAQGENLHAVRFIGDKCYLVTFIKTDPLFVIDLSQPSNPKVLGELNIPGYSDYLHPIDETHLIGVGKEAVGAQDQNFAWYQGLKLALFDVSNVNNPVQLANYVIGDRGTDSPVLTDPKAFLFDSANNLLVIPVSLALVDNSTLQQTGQSQASAYGTTVWQGAYVFSLTSNGGFTLKGTVTHLNATLLDSQGHLISSADYWGTQNQWITRSLYIGNTLYTISNAEVKLNSLTDMSQIAQINLQ
jgi:uncharacterized secreted protein with C-terminal beta-propeller domain